MPEALVPTERLEANLSRPNQVVVDCSWYLPEAKRSGRDEYISRHIPGARFLDLNDISDAGSPYANMMPPPEQFARVVGDLGIGHATDVIVYDAGYVSARIWWMFRTFGHQRVHILDGGIRKWVAEGRSVENGEPAPIAALPFTATLDETAIARWQDVLQSLEYGSCSIADARTAERFTGALSSGYPGVPGGHIPGSVNLPWNRFLKGDFSFVSPEAARSLFDAAGVDPQKPVIATCGSGVTAAILVLMLERLGVEGSQLYDGSWHQWAQQPDLPKSSIAPSL